MYYKFLESGDVYHVLIEGTMMVSSLSYFRKLELGDIGDPLEGGTRLTVRKAIIATEGSPELEMLNAADIGLGSFKQFPKIEHGGQLIINEA